MNFQKNTKDMLENVLDSSIRFVKKNLMYLSNKWLKLNKNRVIAWLPEKGRVEFEVYLPNVLPELQTVQNPDFTSLTQMSTQFLTFMRDMISSVDWDYSIWDTVYKYKPLASPSNWLPPFNGMILKPKVSNISSWLYCVP